MQLEREAITDEMLGIIHTFKLGDWCYREGYEDIGFTIYIKAREKGGLRQ